MGAAGGTKSSSVQGAALRSGDPCRDSWRHRLSFKLIFGLLVFFFIFSAAAYLAMRVRGRDVIAEQSDQLTNEVGRKLVLQLKQHIEASEVLARTLATLGETLPREVETFKKVIPTVVNLEGKQTLIAGGGIWPEPGCFQENVARRSFFWGRNSAGVLEYFDDYNATDGPGYHNEEWYEPARHVKPGQVYWSKSYMDPYSFEPMVTCTAPMYRAGVFSGVATIDLKLNGIAAIMHELARSTGGYAFVVDRNNNFICFPDPKIASRQSVDAKGKQIQEQRDVASVAAEFGDFASVASALQAIDQSARARMSADTMFNFSKLVKLLSAKILQLAPNEAERIAQGVMAVDGPLLEPVKLELPRDIVLGQPVQMLMYEMPSTHWRVGLAMPMAKSQAVVDLVIHRVAVLLLGVSLLVCIAAWVYFNRALLRPLAAITGQLRKLTDDQDLHAHLPVNGQDELARLAYWFNIRTGLLEQSYNELKENNLLLVQAREAAENADRSKNIFLASMSHELRTPLNAVIGMSAFMHGTRLDPEQAEYVRTIHSSSNALLDLVNDIMDFSKIEAGQLELESTVFDLRTILDEITDILAYQTAEKGLKFSCMLEPENDGHVRGDPGRVRQIIANLGANAVKFTRVGEVALYGRILKGETPESVTLEFTVRDTGIGIPDAARERLFKPYSQAVSSTTRKYGGTGLGLVISKRLCQHMQGDIDFESKPNEGTTFKFSIRLGVASGGAVSMTKPRVTSLSEWRCVVVDPDAVYGDLLKRQLSSWGLVAIHAETLENAAKCIAETGDQSVMIFSGLDERTNPGIGVKLRGLVTTKPVKIVLHQQNSLRENCEELGKCGYDVFLPKPLRVGQLARAIEALLGTPANGSAQEGAGLMAQANEVNKRQVLVVEDNLLNQKVVLKMLKNIGHDHVLAENGLQALEAVEKKHYDIILMDWHMPEMDGLEATRRIRSLGGRYAVMPIIALTASALQNEREQCFTAGMNDYLSKPVTEKNLKAMLQKWLGCASVV